MPGITLATLSSGGLKKIKTFTELPGIKLKKEKAMREDYIAEKLRKAKELSKKSEKRFLNTLLNICVLNAMVDWSDKDPKQEFKDVAELLIVYMHASEIEVDK